MDLCVGKNEKVAATSQILVLLSVIRGTARASSSHGLIHYNIIDGKSKGNSLQHILFSGFHEGLGIT